MNSFEKILENCIGEEIDITIVHPIEGQRLVTTGILKNVTADDITIMLEYREHWYSWRKKKALYYLNRKAASLLNIVYWMK